MTHILVVVVVSFGLKNVINEKKNINLTSSQELVHPKVAKYFKLYLN